MNKMIYLNAEEMAFVGEQGPGFVRGLVREAMGNPTPLAETPPQTKAAPPRKSTAPKTSDPGWECKVCTAPLAYYKQPVCPLCKAKQ